MEVIYEVTPTRPARLQELMKPGPHEPVSWVNMLKFPDKAAYADRRETEFSGREACSIYSREVVKLLPKFKGQAVVSGLKGHFNFKTTAIRSEDAK